MNFKKLTTFSLSVLCVLLTVVMANAQTFNGTTTNQAGNSSVPSSGTGGCNVAGGDSYINAVAGLTNQVVSNVRINLTHTWTGDLNIHLQSPSGQIIELSTGNGGTGDNYTNTVFQDGSPSITGGTAPFTGTFAPEGTLTGINCGGLITPTVTALNGFTAAQNGNWTLRISDNAGGDSGAMISWAITFEAPCAFTVASLPNLSLPGTNPAVCGYTGNLTAPTITATCAAGTLIAVTIDGTAFGTVASGASFAVSLSSGLHTVTYKLPNGISLSQSISVSDGVNPLITCPANIYVNLGEGACSEAVDYSVLASDNCPVFGPSVTSATQGSSATNNNNFASIQFDVRNNGTLPINIKGFNANLGAFPGPGYVGTVNVSVYKTNGTTAIGVNNNAAAWTQIVTAQPTAVNVANYYDPTYVALPVSAQFILQPGQSKGILLNTTNGNFMRYANGNQTTTDGTLTIISNGHYAGGAPFALGNTPRMFKGSVVYNTALPAPPVTQISGLPSGAQFPIGTTTNCFVTTDGANNTSSCCFNVIVKEYPNPIHQLNCNDLIYVSLDQDCSACVGADDILEGGPYGCYDHYIVELDRTAPFGNGPWTNSCVSASDVGKTYQVRVTDPETGNKCWGSLKIEDKLAPVLTCCDYTLPCNADASPIFGNVDLVVNASGNAVAIPDLTTVNSVANVGACAGSSILDVNVSLKLTHTFVGDLRLTVVS
ncbi:MAG: hypothetical protein RIQ78_1642, partial [Bacteroidota bacterium]